MSLSNDSAFDQISRGYVSEIQVPVYQSSSIYQGAMVALHTASGCAVKAGTAATSYVLGIAGARANNASGSTGDVSINILQGLFVRSPHATHPPVQADMGKIVYASDDNTISNTASDGVVAGILQGFDAYGNPVVFINAALNRMLATFPPLPTGNGSYILTITSGVPSWTTHT